MTNRESPSEQNTSKWALYSFQKQEPVLPKADAYCFCCQKRQKGKFQYGKVVRQQLSAGDFCWQLQFGGRPCSPQHLLGFLQHQHQHLKQLGQQESSSMTYLVHEAFRNRAGVCQLFRYAPTCTTLLRISSSRTSASRLNSSKTQQQQRHRRVGQRCAQGRHCRLPNCSQSSN